MITCPICVEKYTCKLRRRIVCASCENEFCSRCAERHILGSSGVPQCMHCQMRFDLEFIYLNMTKIFISRLRVRNMRLLIEQEKRLLLDTQKYAEYKRYVDTLRGELSTLRPTIATLTSRIGHIENELCIKRCPSCGSESVYYLSRYCSVCLCNICHVCHGVKEDGAHACDERRKGMMNQYAEMINQRYATVKEKEAILKRIRLWDTKAVMVSKHHDNNESNKMMCACPRGRCTGFIREDTGKCTLCKGVLCMRCFCLIDTPDGEHRCDSNNMDALRLIHNSTKRCPKCLTSIEKIDGCNQMWCTNCNSAFNWLTGKSESGVVHNPHYFQWLRDVDNLTGINAFLAPEHIDQEVLPNWIHFGAHLKRVFAWSDEMAYVSMAALYRLVVWIQRMLRHQHEMEPNDIVRNLDLRLRWINNEINTKIWGDMLYRRYKTRCVRSVRDRAFGLFVARSITIMNRTMSTYNSIVANALMADWIDYVRMANVRFRDLSHTFRIQMPVINKTNERYVVKLRHKYQWDR